MEITQEEVVSLLVAGNGRVKSSDLQRAFHGSLDSSDPAEKKRLRDVFKRIVNQFAVVKEIEGVKYVVLKTKYGHLLLTEGPAKGDHDEPPRPGERTPAAAARKKRSPPGDPQGPSAEDPPKPRLTVAVAATPGVQAVKVSKSSQEEPMVRDPRFSSAVPLETLKGRPPKTRQSHGSPSPSPPPPGVQAVKVSKSSQEEPAARDPRFSSAVPLEPSEHAWLVKSAAGQWGQVYGLLLRDNQLVEKRDFMSGFTALHWAAKCGNSDILAKMIRVSRERGADVDVNARAHGGYTPLHIAALHDQEYVLSMLAGEFGADVRLRDNCGKRAYHYLHGGITGRVRELLGEPRPAQPPPEQEAAGQQEREDMDLFQDLSKGLHTISRLFQPHATVTHRKRHKHRPEFYSLSEEPREESE
ncbi:hypothetical protein CRUP_014339 [Coryphaenoides rupestris]|nr:hypothetical protein CRUP_014339 [Coryphaenoides rupestris]